MTDVTLTIDGLPVTVPAGTTVFDAARMNGIPIPTLCHQQNENPVGVCRVCVVDVGARVYAASCIRPAENGMKVQTATDGVLAARHTLVELRTRTPCYNSRHHRITLPETRDPKRQRRFLSRNRC
jgi:NADH dehydrogenase/NADH:ubiquinone oxidoreductase subunit G